MFEALFTLEPAGIFGLPESGRTVVPAGSSVAGCAVDSRTLKRVGHGTLSSYRSEDEKLAISVELPCGMLRASDNLFWLTLDAPDMKTAISASIDCIEQLLRHLTALR